MTLPSEKQCNKCGHTKPYTEFYKHPFGEGGRDSKCKECAKSYARERRKDPSIAAEINEKDRVRKSTPLAKEKRRVWRRAKKNDPEFRMAKKMRELLARCMTRFSMSKTGQTYEVLGYTSDMLRQRLECQFKEGMSWENYGRFGWHIDHKKPILAFVNQGIKSPRTINALCNLQPMWATENISKGWSWSLGGKPNLRSSEMARQAANDNQAPQEEAA